MTRTIFLAAAIAILVYSSGSFAQSSTAIDTAAIEQATGLKGVLNKDENVFKVAKPRADVKIEVDGWQIPRSWVSAHGPPSRRAKTAKP